MSTHEHSRRAHELVDAIKDGYTPDRADVDFLRSFLPELPKQKTLEELRREVYDVWAGTIENEWPDDMYCDLENWLYELHVQLQGLADAEPAKPAHPEFLETEADYENAPEGTIVALDGVNPWVKEESVWMQGTTADATVYRVPCLKGPRRVLRWGEGNE